MAVAATLLSAGIGAASSVVGGMAAGAQADYQAQVAKNNVKIANQNAYATKIAGDREAEAFRMNATNLIATQAANQAAGGIDIGIGSPAAARGTARILEELDVGTIQNNALRKAYNFRAEAKNFAAQSELYGMEADQSRLSGFLEGAGSLIGGVSGVADKWSSMRSPVAYSGGSPSSLTVPTVTPPSSQYTVLAFH